MDKIEKELRTMYSIEQAKHQIKIYKARKHRMDTPLQRYFNSSDVRNTFARQMFIAANVKSLYTKKAIAEELGISWQAAHTMVEECKASGWVEVDRNGKCPTYKASDSLVEAHFFYVDYHNSKEVLCGACRRPIRRLSDEEQDKIWQRLTSSAGSF